MHDDKTTTDTELSDHMKGMSEMIQGALPEDTGFVLMAAPFNNGGNLSQIVSNANADDVVKWLREAADWVESSRNVQR